MNIQIGQLVNASTVFVKFLNAELPAVSMYRIDKTYKIIT